MKFTQFTLAAALLATASAQGLDALPDCSKTCATSSIPANCGLNVECICSDKSFLSNIACCVADKCSQADQETTLQVAKGICSRGGVTDLPSTISCTSSGSSTATGTSSGTMAGSTTESKTGSMTSTATDTTLIGSATATKTGTSTTGSAASSASSAASSASSAASSAAATTGAAVLGQTRDSSLMAAAGAAAAFAIFV